MNRVSAQSTTYTITVSAGPNGSITPSGQVPLGAGSSQTFTAAPNPGYMVDRWYLDGSAVWYRWGAYTLRDIQASHTVQVTFVRDYWWTIHHDAQNTCRSPYNGPSAPRLEWVFQTEHAVGACMIGPDGTIYADSERKILAISPDGKQKWAFETGSNAIVGAIGSDGTIYAESRDGSLYAIGPGGTRKWTYQTGSGGIAPAIGADGTIYVASGDMNLYAIDESGNKKWACQIGNPTSESPAIGADGTIYVGSRDKNLYAINPDGTKKWAFAAGQQITTSPVIAADGTIYVGSDDMNLYAINPDGTKKWAYRLPNTVDLTPAIGADGTIYTESNDSTYAINPDGTRKWDVPVQSKCGGAAIGADGTIHVGSGSGLSLYAMNPDGSKKWEYKTDSYVGASAIGSDGTVYASTTDGKIYAIGGMQASLALYKSVSAASAALGGTVTYTLSYENTGGSQASGVTVTDTLPAGVIYVNGSATGGGVYNAGTITWTIGAVAGGAPKQDLTFQAVVNHGASGVITNTGSISADGIGPISSNEAAFTVDIAKYTITTSAGSNGSISPITAQQVTAGGSLTCTATPNTGYSVDVWSVDGTTAQTGGAQFTLSNIAANHTVKVTFKASALTVTPSAGPNGSISPSTAQQVPNGGSVTFTATPATGYAVDRWLVDGSAVQGGGTQFTLSNITADHTVKVLFAVWVPTVTPTAGANGTVTPNTARQVTYGGSISLVASANTGYAIDIWWLDGVPVQSGGPVFTLSNVTADHSVKVTFGAPRTWVGMCMVSCPVAPAGTDPKPVVGFAGNSWWCYQPSPRTYAAYPNATTWFTPVTGTPGRGFWAYFDSWVYTPTGAIAPQNRPVTIHLLAGWNLIGNPYISSLKWDTSAIRVRAAGTPTPVAMRSAHDVIGDFAWGWKPNAQNPNTGAYYLVYDSNLSPGYADSLTPWEGYWVIARKECDLILPPPGN